VYMHQSLLPPNAPRGVVAVVARQRVDLRAGKSGENHGLAQAGGEAVQM